MKFYRYIYYNLVLLWERKKDEPENAKPNAVLTISILQLFFILDINIMMIIADKNELINLPDFKLPEIDFNAKIWIVVFMLVIAILNYIFLAREKQFLRIVKEFENMNEKEKRRGRVKTILLITTIMGFPMCIFFLSA